MKAHEESRLASARERAYEKELAEAAKELNQCAILFHPAECPGHASSGFTGMATFISPRSTPQPVRDDRDAGKPWRPAGW